MKQKLILLLFALLSTMGAWADTYTITYKYGAGGTLYNGRNNVVTSGGWNAAKWVSGTVAPIVTIQGDGNNPINSNNYNLANGRTFTISVAGSYFISGYKISSTGWGSTVTPEGGEGKVFTSGVAEELVVSGLNTSSTSFSNVGANLPNPTIDIYIEDRVNYASSVIANVKPHFDNADHYFCLTSTALAAYQSDYDTYSVNCTEEEYNTLLGNVNGLYSELNNVCLPSDGFYRLKNEEHQNYLYYENESDGMCVGDKVKAVGSVVYIHRSGNTFSLNLQGKYVQTPGPSNGTSAEIGGDEVFFTPRISGVSAAMGYAAINVGGRCFSPHGSAIWSWGMYAKASHWKIEAAEDVTISLTAANDNTDAAHTYATLCVPFEITGLTGAGGEVKAYAPTKDGDFIIPGEGASTVAAGTPVILIGEEGATSVTATIGSDYTNTPATTNILTGTFTDTDIDPSAETGTNYVLGFDDENDNLIGFYHVNRSSITLGANRAYLHIEGAGVKGFAINFGDDATSINELRMKSEESGAAIYNLAGQRISKVQKGVNIMNGKKVMVK